MTIMYDVSISKTEPNRKADMAVRFPFPEVGDLVIVNAYQNVSGASSVPHSVKVADYIGELRKIDDVTYMIVDHETEVARIVGVYHAEEDDWKEPTLWLSGWLETATGRVWGKWRITN
jgi:hypothetical protein